MAQLIQRRNNIIADIAAAGGQRIDIDTAEIPPGTVGVGGLPEWPPLLILPAVNVIMTVYNGFVILHMDLLTFLRIRTGFLTKRDARRERLIHGLFIQNMLPLAGLIAQIDQQQANHDLHIDDIACLLYTSRCV